MHLKSGGTSKRKGHCHTSPDDHLHTCAQFSLALLQVEARSRLRDASGDKIQSVTQEADLEFKAEVQVDCPGYVAKRLILRAAQVVAASIARAKGRASHDLLKAGLRQPRLSKGERPEVRLRLLSGSAASTAGRR